MNKLILCSAFIIFSLHSAGQTTGDSVRAEDSVHAIPDSAALTTDSINAMPGIPVHVDLRNTGEVYRLKAATDIPVTAIGTGWSLYAFTKIYSKDKSSVEKILSLDKNDIPSIDRRGARVYHPAADNVGDKLFYGSMPLPVILMFDREIRKDALKIALLYLQSMSITGLLYTGSVYLADRYRPYAYNPEVPMDRRRRGGAKNSFFAGHVALVGTATFFVAKVLNDYHPDSKVRWLPFTLAGIATGTTGLMRYRGGQHFLSDIALGTVVGVLSGVLVPHIHKNSDLSERRLSFNATYLGDHAQFGVSYRLMK